MLFSGTPQTHPAAAAAPEQLVARCLVRGWHAGCIRPEAEEQLRSAGGAGGITAAAPAQNLQCCGQELRESASSSVAAYPRCPPDKTGAPLHTGDGAEVDAAVGCCAEMLCSPVGAGAGSCAAARRPPSAASLQT